MKASALTFFLLVLFCTGELSAVEEERKERKKRSVELWRVSYMTRTQNIKTLLAPFNPLHRQWGDDSLTYSTSKFRQPTLAVHYRKGSYSRTSQRGAGFYSTPPEVHVDKLILMYDVYFDNFGWGKGGKLPGLFGGEKRDGAYECSGGSNPSSCFSLRLMWRENGQGELYAYLPMDSQERGFANRRDVIGHSSYGTSIGRGKIRFKNGRWQTVLIQASLNRPGRTDGYVKFCNKVQGEAQQCYTARNLAMRDSRHPNHHIRGLFFTTFFGGSTSAWAAPNACNTYFKNFRLRLPTGYEEMRQFCLWKEKSFYICKSFFSLK